MSDTINKTFSIQAPITKCYSIKKADGTERYVVEGLASGTEMDLTSEQMAVSAIDSMVKSREVHKIELNNEHSPAWDSVYGEVVALWKTDANDMMIQAELKPWHYRTVTLVKTLEEGGQIALSIEGTVVDAILEWSNDLKRMVKTYKEILLKKISTTGTPAYANSWLTNINKSVTDWKELPMLKPLEMPVKKTDVLTETEQSEAAKPEANAPVEAPQTDITPTPDAKPEETPAPAEGVKEEVTPPVEPAAPAKEAEVVTPAEEATKSTPAPAKDDTSEVTKAAILGSFAEADVAMDAVGSLAYNLKWFIWGVVVDTEKSKEEKSALITSGLAEFSQIVSNVANSLVTNGVSEETVKSTEATRSETPEALSRSLSDKDTKVAELTKSVETKSKELSEVTKTLKDMTEELEETQKSLKEEAETKQKFETELTTIKARKTLAFNEGARKALIVDDSTPDIQPNQLPKKLHGVF